MSAGTGSNLQSWFLNPQMLVHSYSGGHCIPSASYGALSHLPLLIDSTNHCKCLFIQAPFISVSQAVGIQTEIKMAPSKEEESLIVHLAWKFSFEQIHLHSPTWLVPDPLSSGVPMDTHELVWVITRKSSNGIMKWTSGCNQPAFQPNELLFLKITGSLPNFRFNISNWLPPTDRLCFIHLKFS